jgi:hypothetical protein
MQPWVEDSHDNANADARRSSYVSRPEHERVALGLDDWAWSHSSIALDLEKKGLGWGGGLLKHPFFRVVGLCHLGLCHLGLCFVRFGDEDDPNPTLPITLTTTASVTLTITLTSTKF